MTDTLADARLSHHRGPVSLGLAILLSLGTWSAFGVGSRIPNQDATAIGRGNAFVATADNPAAIYYNPAGITQLEGLNVQAGLLVYPHIGADFQSSSGEYFENKPKPIGVPQFHCTYSLKEQPISFGLGIYAPFGLGMEWPDNVPFRNAGLEANVTYATINPVVAWRPLPSLSLAIGPTINYSEATLRQGVLAPPLRFKFKGDGWAYGYAAGILWQPLPKWSFGAKYMSGTGMDYDGTASFGPPGAPMPAPSHITTHLEYPQIVAGGISFRPTTNWNVEVDIDWTDWDVVKNARIGNIDTLPLNWHSSFMYEFGVTRQLGKGYFISAGYFYSEASTPERDFTPLVPDTDLHVGSLGIGYRGRRWDWALSGQIIGGDYRNISNNADPTVNGRFRLLAPTVSMSVGYHF